jgi:hypothetical protein
MAQMPVEVRIGFPCVLSKRAGIDKSVLEMMDPLVDAGVGSSGLFSLIRELHSKRFVG